MFVFGKQTAKSLFFFLLPLSLWGNQAGLIFEAEKQYFIESRGQCEDEENMVRD